MKNNNSTETINHVWSVILPDYEQTFSTMVAILNKARRLNIPEQEVINSINENQGIYFFGKKVCADIGNDIYHITLAENLRGIIEKGLEPKICDESEIPDKPSIPTVFMAKSPSYGSCICDSARENPNQTVVELNLKQIEIFTVNSYGHKIAEYDPHKLSQIGSHEHILPKAIERIYINSNSPNSNFAALEEIAAERGIPLIALDFSLSLETKTRKNTWTRVIAEYMGENKII